MQTPEEMDLRTAAAAMIDREDRRRLEQQAAAESRAVEAMRVLHDYYGHTREDLHELVDEAIEQEEQS